MSRKNKKTGYIALISVLVLSALALTVIIGGFFLTGNSTATNISLVQSHQAKALADACVEEALQQIRNSYAFSGSGSVALGQGTCNYTVIDLGGQNRQIDTIGFVGQATRRNSVSVVQINPTIKIGVWSEY